jgi:transcription antitermination factor NusG
MTGDNSQVSALPKSQIEEARKSASLGNDLIGAAQPANEQPWYALSVRSRYERIVVTFLSHQGYEWFLPFYKSRRCWSDRIKEIEVPLFPGYLFCRFDIHNRLPVLRIPGVQYVVGGTRIPTPIDTSEIHALQTVIRTDALREPWPFLRVGDRVRIERGSLAGVEGILLQFKGRHRLVLSVTLLQRSVAVEIDSAWVRLGSRESSPGSLRVNLNHTSTASAPSCRVPETPCR